ncbi:MAG: hypothetical protein Fur0032_21630 [Terrimicrobiaceae bacterium]
MPSDTPASGPVLAGSPLATRLALGRGTARLSAGFGEPLAMESIHAVWKKVVANNPLLRSGFRQQADGTLIQNEQDGAELDWTELDWTELPREELAARWSRLLADDVTWDGGWDTPPLIKATGIRLPGGVPHLLVTYPGFLLTEEDWFFLLCELVEGLEGRVPLPATDPQPELGLIPSADPAWWNGLRAAGPSPRLLNPLHPAGKASTGWHTTLLDREVTRSLVENCRRFDLEPSTALLGLWSLLVARKISRDEILLLASPPGTGDNPLPCRFRLSKRDSLQTLLRAFAEDERIRSAVAGTSLGTLEWENGRRVTKDDFVCLFEFKPPALNDRIPDAYPRWINLDARILEDPLHRLVLEVRHGDRLGLRLHAADLEARAGEALLAELEAVVRQFAAKPSSTVHACWQDDPVELPARRPEPPVAPAPIHDTIAEQASNSPEAAAVEDASGALLTYGEMDAHAAKLAGHLSRQNLTAGWTIGVCLTPSTWVPVAMLGILRAGDTCLPLEPDCAPDWLGAQLDGADCELVICDSGTEALFSGSQHRLLVIDRDWALISEVGPAGDQETAAKVAFLLAGTDRVNPPPIRSFSHTFLAACCARSARRSGLGVGDRLVVTAPAGSAAFLEGILGGLAVGSTVILPGTDADALLPDLRASHVRLTAEAFRARVAALRRSGTPLEAGSLKSVTIDLSGGFLPSKTAAAWQDLSGGIPLTVFLSPCGFLGVGLQNEMTVVDETFPSVAAGIPTSSSGCSFRDPVGLRPAAGYPGRLDFHPTHGDPVNVAWPAWRDALGQLRMIQQPEDQPAWEAFSSEDVLDVALDRDRPGLCWVVTGSEASAPEGTIPVGQIPIRHGRQDSRALPSPQSHGKPVKARVSLPEDRGVGAHRQVVEAVEKVPAASPFELRSLGGNPEAPLLIIVDPEGRATHAISAVLEPDWSLASLDCPAEIEDPVRLAMRWLAALPDEVPLHFLGLGAAGMVAYEITRLLRASGRDVPYLAIAGTVPPEAPKRVGWLGSLVRGRQSKGEKGYHPEPLEGPCGIIFTSDLPAAARDRWGQLAPDALTKQTKRSLSDLLGPDPGELANLLSAFSGESID